MYDLKLTLHKHKFSQTCEFIEAFGGTITQLTQSKALCSVETYDDKAIIYVSTLQMDTNLFLRNVSHVEIERGNFNQYVGAEVATLTNYFSEEHTVELVIAKLKGNRRFIVGTVMTEHKVEITKELLKKFDWDNKEYDERQVLLDHLLPALTDKQRYEDIVIAGVEGVNSFYESDIVHATIDELF